MLQFEELRLRLEAHRAELDEFAQAIGYDALRRKLAELEEQTTAPGFWNDVERSQKNQLETARVRGKLEACDKLNAHAHRAGGRGKRRIRLFRGAGRRGKV